MSGDPINHPSHYTSSPARCKCCGQPIECIDVVEHLSFCIGNIIKYLWRADHKGDPIKDLEKGLWYLTREIQRRKRQQVKA
jgi:Protein of unknwon function (DUF3310)